MSGLVGRIEYEAQSVEALAPYRDLLAAGSWLRVGKGTVMGLGKYEVSMASYCRQQERGKQCTWC